MDYPGAICSRQLTVFLNGLKSLYRRFSVNKFTQNYQFWCLFLFLILVFLTGGGSRADIQSIVVLRPASVIFFGIGLWGLKRQHITEYRFLFAMAVAICVLVLIHLVPLPPPIWRAIPGRELLVEIDRVAGLGDVWRPISLVPAATWNSFFSLFAPLAVLLLVVQVSREHRFALLAIIIGLGLLSGFLGLLQAIGPSDGPLYLYKITNNGSAVGLFSNRNHQAVFLSMLFPMLAVFASTGIRTAEQAKFFGWLAIAAGAVIIPLLLVTGSRAGVVVGVVSLGLALFLYRTPKISQPAKRKNQRFNPRVLFGGLGVLILGLVTFLMARAQAFERLSAEDGTEDLRLLMWGPIAEMANKYFPVGSGVGSFVETYQIDEPHALLSNIYVNHAHNDWLEVYLTTGVLGLVLIVFGLLAACFATVRILRLPTWNRDKSFGLLGASVLFILALASLVDYPLRIPSLACVFVIAAVWVASRDTLLPKRTGTN